MNLLTRSALRLAPLLTAGDGVVVIVLLMALGWFGTLAAAPADTVPPEELSRAVERELRADPVLQDADLYAISRHGEVTLGGTVDRLLWQRRAERAAETVRGVRHVVNRIAVMPPSHVPDLELAAGAHRALAAVPGLALTDVTVQVENGRVQLEGVAGSPAMRDWADEVVAGLMGVREVQNRMSIAPGGARADAPLVDALYRAIAFDGLLEGDRVQVTASGSRATLTGEVNSAAERRRARALAARAGAAEVDTSALVVSGGVRTRATAEPPPDAAIEQAVREALAADPRLHAHRLAVRVQSGEVKLAGTAPTLAEKQLAARVARYVRGVRRVHEHVTVTTTDVGGRALAARALAALRADPLVGDQPMAVTVNKDIAVLTGTTATPWQRQHAEAVVAAVPGIGAVHNQLRAGPRAPFVSDKPYVGAPFIVTQTSLPADKTTTDQDAAIHEAVASQLQWSAFIDAQGIHLSVNRGVATLTGRVATPMQAALATQEAYEGGARLVKNLLAIE
ncbi:MAG: BON domain-containing protein [Gammaproteobacteria bacterium]|nr:BON domain-containing protein [Gammaproteobacteria bacterium]